jgi:hypothetical protein
MKALNHSCKYYTRIKCLNMTKSIVYDISADNVSIMDIYSYETFAVLIKVLSLLVCMCFLSLFIRPLGLCTLASKIGILATFVNTFRF